MKVEFSNTFDKQTSRIKDKNLTQRIGAVISNVTECKSLAEVPNIKPIKGYPGFYRIRVGHYRLGISLEDNTVWFHFFGKRNKSTYKKMFHK